MNWLRQTRVHLIGISFFFLFDFIFYYPKVVIDLQIPLWIFSIISLAFALHIWYFNFFTVYFLHKFIPRVSNRLRSRIFLLLLLLPIVVLTISVFQSFFFTLLNKQIGTSQFYIRYEDVGMNLLYSLVIVFFLELLHYFQQWTKAVSDASELKKTNVLSQLNSLKNQVNPHFLFNSLNSLSSLIRKNQDDAVRFVHELSGVYRYLLQTNERDLCELREELIFLNSYLHLLKTRFGNALQYSITIDETNSSFLLPPLSLQMLVENAVKHNVIATSSPLCIQIYNEGAYVVIKNNLQKKQSKVISHGVGLSNILSQYRLITNRSIEITETEESFTVKLPLLNVNNYESIDHRG